MGPTFLPSEVHRKQVINITNARVCPVLKQGAEGLSPAPQGSHMQCSEAIAVLPVDDGPPSQKESESGGVAVGCQVEQGGALIIDGGVDSPRGAL